MKNQSIWAEDGNDKNYQWYRSNDHFQDLRTWADKIYYENGLSQYLDKGFLKQLRDHDFFARLWELKVAEYLKLTGLKLIPTNGFGADFCIKLDDGRKIWIEAVLAKPNEDLKRTYENMVRANGGLVDYPAHSMALRYSSSLYSKGTKIKEKYIDKELIGKNDIVLIAISSFPPGTGLDPNIEHFLRAIMPMGDPVIHISNDGSPLDPNINRTTHSSMPSQVKRTIKEGVVKEVDVKKQFLYPGAEFSFIDGVLFTEAKDLQGLMGRVYNIFSDDEFDGSLDPPHIFLNYTSKKQIPTEFTDYFYLHKFVDNPPLVSVEEQEPKREIATYLILNTLIKMNLYLAYRIRDNV